jgi:crotonobetainyl-CoA:carnitine CoA-transferase CaiB-like acyl-CoA transferase
VTLPLRGQLVVDMADEPLVMASTLLANLGATVVRAESLAGDGVRRRGPFVADIPGVERSLAHLRYNAGKQSLALALDRPEGWAIAGVLASRADVIIAPLEKDALAARFFDEGHLAGIAPSVGVVDAVFRRGSNESAVTDMVGAAAGGLLYLNGFEGEPPNLPAGKLAYKQTSLAAALGAVSLCLERALSGAGGRITVSMQEAVMWTTIQTANENYWYWLKVRPGRHGLGSVGGQTVFEAREGGWVSFYQHPPYWPNFVQWVAEALGDTRFADAVWEDQLYRLRHMAEVTDATRTLCQTMSRDELVKEGQRRSILVVPVQGVTDIATDPHLRERGFFQSVWHEQIGASLETVRAPFISTAYEMETVRAPALGEHSREVLSNLCGYDEQTIEDLVTDGVVNAPAGVPS